jgi:hypothetical protein
MLGDHLVFPILLSKDLAAAWAAWIVDPSRNILGIMQLKT